MYHRVTAQRYCARRRGLNDALIYIRHPHNPCSSVAVDLFRLAPRRSSLMPLKTQAGLVFLR